MPSLIASAKVSPTLAADALVQELREEGRTIFHMGFGQAPFPAPDRLKQALRDNAHEKAYLPIAGLPELRAAVCAHQALHTGIDPAAVDALVAPGSKLILYAAQMAVEGDLLLPTPSWVSYAPQAALLGQDVIPVPALLSEAGYQIDAEGLKRTISGARSAGKNPSKILLNYPNNPTGLTIPEHNLKELARVCIEEDILIISDEIYGRLSFDGVYRSIALFAPERTVVTTGLSKHLSLGGWRLGVGTIPKAVPGLFDALVGIASETWSCVAAPVQIAAVEAYAGHADLEAFIRASTQIHASVTGYIYDRLNAAGIPCVRPQGGFYAYPDLGPVAGGIGSSAELCDRLIRQEGIVTLPGDAFGEAPGRLTLRLSACDYDGHDALETFARSNGVIGEAEIAEFAPRVIASMDGF
ncbi:MAG: aminotransferase class I/II-fold pyridoxal phosphate-dependent enzyme, partial [Pseudomonadota bacterium]